MRQDLPNGFCGSPSIRRNAGVTDDKAAGHVRRPLGLGAVVGFDPYKAKWIAMSKWIATYLQEGLETHIANSFYAPRSPGHNAMANSIDLLLRHLCWSSPERSRFASPLLPAGSFHWRFIRFSHQPDPYDQFFIDPYGTMKFISS
jgi:hypothetical protein